MGILEGRERPWRRREDSFADVLNAAKPLLTRFCVAKSVTYPPNLPNPPRTSPQTPALYTVKCYFALYGGGCLWGSSFSFLGGIYALKSAAFAPDLRAGCVGREYAFRKCRFIPPHQSLTRQLPPEGKPSLLCANMANIYVVACLCDPLVALLCSAKGLLQKGFPLGGSCRVSD